MSCCPLRQYGAHTSQLLLYFFIFNISRLCVILVTNVFRHLNHLSMEHIPILYFYAKKTLSHTGVQQHQAHGWGLGITESFCIYQILTKTSAVLISCCILSISLQKSKANLTILRSLSITQTLYFEFCDADCHSSI